MPRYTKKQIKNLKFAAEVVWPSVPEKNVAQNLWTYTESRDDTTDCKTIACGGGWLSRHPFFQKQGVYINENGWPALLGKPHSADLVAELVFGDLGLFARRGCHRADDELIARTDHEVFANRLKWNLERTSQ